MPDHADPAAEPGGPAAHRAGVPARAIDPDVDLRVPPQAAELRRAPWSTLGAIALGGALGALARAGVTAGVPRPPGGFPWAVLGVNTTGCLLIGALMVLVAETPRAPRLARPFLGTGVLGGFTTFSAYAVDIRALLDEGRPAAAFGYAAGTLAAALLAVAAGVRATRRLVRRLVRPAERGSGR
ncbi:fluoride efflux transporter FluC [Spirillospora albida]|uniref:fluoride efflux transporter FluC n=1 Tax=Spirillospora albida TaxID=58123 RepID=UPI0009FC2F2F|nr:CrcB family protein [Spirillospora albida]